MGSEMNQTVCSCDDAVGMILLQPERAEDRTRLNRHLELCSACQHVADGNGALDRQLRTALVQEPPAWLTAAVMARATAPERAGARWKDWAASVIQWSLYLGIGAFALLLLSGPGEPWVSWQVLVSSFSQQMAVLTEVLVTTLQLIPVDDLLSSIDDTQWVYPAASLLAVVWWLRGLGPRTSVE